MNDKAQGLMEDIWYSVQLRENPSFRYDYPVKVEGKVHFVGKLIVHVGNQLIFNLQDDKGSVVLPFNLIEWMVALYKVPKKKEERSWLDDL